MASKIRNAMTAALKQMKSGNKPDIVERAKKFIGQEVVRREEWERNAYVNVMLKEGHHWVNDQGISDQRDPNQLRRHVNKFKSLGRGLKNNIVYNDPMVEALPDNGEQVDQRQLDLAVAVLRNEFNMAGTNGEGMKSLMRTMIDEAAHKAFACVSVIPNTDKDSNRINDIEVHDSFDVFFDNHDLSKAQIIVLSSWEDKDYLENEGFKNVHPASDNLQRSHSSLKREFERIHNREGQMQPDHLLVDNVYYVEYEREADGTIIPGKKKLMNIVLSAWEILREPQELVGYENLGELFFLYYMETNRFVKYPTPWMSDIVPLQRSLNDASENIDTMLHWIAKVRFLQREGASNTVQMIGDRHVQKIRYSGEKPQFMEFPQIPPQLFQQAEMRESEMEDMVGIHASSLGRSTGDRVSGRKEAMLSAGDSDNVSEPVSELQKVLSIIFAQVLINAEHNMSEVTKIAGAAGEIFQAVGDKAYQDMSKAKKKKNGDVVPVKGFKNIKVTIFPGGNALLAQGRQEILTLLPLLGPDMKDQQGVLFDVLLRMYSFGAVRDIAKMLKQKKDEAEAESPDLPIIKAEINLLSMGKTVTGTPEQPHMQHIQLKLLALKTLVDEGAVQSKSKDPVFSAFMSNIGQHQSMLQGQGSPKMGLGTMITGEGVGPDGQNGASPPAMDIPRTAPPQSSQGQ